MASSSDQTTLKAKAIEAFKWIIFPIGLVLASEPVYRQHFYDQTLEEVPGMQEITKLKSFFTTVSAVGSSPLVDAFFILVFNFVPKPAALYFWVCLPTVYFIVHVLKSLYAEDVPYWVSDEISGATCQLGFGNPSHHMTYNVFFWLTLYLHLYNEIGVKVPRMSVFCTAYIIKMAATCIGVSFLIFLGFSRPYLGLNSFNQVIFGVILGGTLALVGHFQVKPLFLRLPELFYSDESGSKYAVTVFSYTKTIFIGLLMPLIFATGILLMREDRAFYYSNAWNYRQTRAGCQIEELTAPHKLHYYHFQQSGAIALAAGAFLGQLFEYRLFVNTSMMDSSAWLWNRTTIVKSMIRIVITGLVTAVCLLPAQWAESIEQLIPAEHEYWKALVSSLFSFTIPYFLTGFVTFGMLRYVFYKVKLDNEEGHGREFQTREQYLRDIGLELDQSYKQQSIDHSTKTLDSNSIELETM